MSATIYVTPESLATMTLVAPLDYYDRCALSDDPASDPTHREGYYLKNLSYLSVSVLPDAAHIVLRLIAGAREVSFPAELRGCIFERAPHLPPNYQSIIAYWSGSPINSNADCAAYYQCPAQRYDVSLAALEASPELISKRDSTPLIDALLSEGVVVSIAGLGGLLSDAADDEFVSVVLPIDEDLLGLDNGAQALAGAAALCQLWQSANRQQSGRECDPPDCHWQEELAVRRFGTGGPACCCHPKPVCHCQTQWA
jgi:hypothetical protein